MEHTRSKERVSQLGEVFTPSHIVDEMHALIPDESWSDPTMIYLEPTCGNGQFVVAAVQKKMDAGLTPYEAVNTVFGMDIMRDNIAECQKRVFVLVKDKVHGKKALETIRCLIVNNIFPVKDSLTYMSTGKWTAKCFFEKDPTGNGMVCDKVLQGKIRTGVAKKGG
jgi:hypothetical protein